MGFGQRRFGNVEVLSVSSGSVPVGTNVFVSAQSGIRYSPKSFIVTGDGSSELRDESGKTFFVGSGNVTVEFPEGLELAKSSGVLLIVGGNPVSANLYYCIVDQTTPVTKIAARTNTFNKQRELDALGRKAIRRPSSSLLGDLS